MKGQLSGFLLFFALLAVSTNGESCFEQTDSDPYLYFSHKTAYQFIQNSKFKPVPCKFIKYKFTLQLFILNILFFCIIIYQIKNRKQIYCKLKKLNQTIVYSSLVF